MLQPGRNISAANYRYGFNGKEQDNDVNGTGVDYNYGFRIYDARVGRFLSVDPLMKAYPQLTPYQFASNKPINSIDVEGAEAVEVIHWFAMVGTSRGAAKLSAPTLNKVFGITEKQTLYLFGFGNGFISAFDVKGLVQTVQNYTFDAMKEMFSMRMNTFMQEDMSYERMKRMLPIVSIAEDTYNNIKNTINLAYAGDLYAAGQVTAMCLTACIGGIEASDIAALRSVTNNPLARSAANILEVTQRIELASKWMGSASKTAYIDFSLDVSEVKLQAGSKLVQYRVKGAQGFGDYYASPGTTPEEIGLNPNDVVQTFDVTVNRNTNALSSTHKKNTTYYRNENVTLEGGGKQIYSKELKNNATFTPQK